MEPELPVSAEADLPVLPDAGPDLFGQRDGDYLMSAQALDCAADDVQRRKLHTGDRLRENRAILYAAVVELSSNHVSARRIATALRVGNHSVAAIIAHDARRVASGRKGAAQRLVAGGFAAVMSAVAEADTVTADKRAIIGGIALQRGLELDAASGMGLEGETLEAKGTDADLDQVAASIRALLAPPALPEPDSQSGVDASQVPAVQLPATAGPAEDARCDAPGPAEPAGPGGGGTHPRRGPPRQAMHPLERANLAKGLLRRARHDASTADPARHGACHLPRAAQKSVVGHVAAGGRPGHVRRVPGVRSVGDQGMHRHRLPAMGLSPVVPKKNCRGFRPGSPVPKKIHAGRYHRGPFIRHRVARGGGHPVVSAFACIALNARGRTRKWAVAQQTAEDAGGLFTAPGTPPVAVLRLVSRETTLELAQRLAGVLARGERIPQHLDVLMTEIVKQEPAPGKGVGAQ